MTEAKTLLGMPVTVTAAELRALAADGDIGAADFLDRVSALPRSYLTPKTLASAPWVIAERLRAVAGFLERWERGEMFKHRGAP